MLHATSWLSTTIDVMRSETIDRIRSNTNVFQHDRKGKSPGANKTNDDMWAVHPWLQSRRAYYYGVRYFVGTVKGIQTFIDPYTYYASQLQWPRNETVLFHALYARSVVRKSRWESSRWTKESFRLRNGARSIVPKSNNTMVQMHTRSGLGIQYFAVTLSMRIWSSELYKSTPMISFSFGPAI